MLRRYGHLIAMALGLRFATPALAERVWGDDRPIQIFPTQERQTLAHLVPDVPSQAAAPNLMYSGGPVIHAARVVSIFWGSSWGTDASPSPLAQHIVGFFGQFGTNDEYNVITQYYDTTGNIGLTNLTTTHWFDSANPPTRVTDAAVVSEVIDAITHSAVGLDGSTVYEVFLPAGSYASVSGLGTSCGGGNVQFCAYHGNFVYAGVDIKYASMPYPSCGGCQTLGWTDGENFDHFSCHETREAVTDPDLNAWHDGAGNEADDKCAWSPTPFLANGFGYQYEWSNLAGDCVTDSPVCADLNCDDGNACTNDACQPGVGCTHTTVNCSDSNGCTDDRCDPAAGCQHPLAAKCIAPLLAGLLDTCGDGHLDPGEECDDGNTRSGDCCSATCRFEPAGSSCLAGCSPHTCNGAGQCQ
jgi:cysteine-rich repeat protein